MAGPAGEGVSLEEAEMADWGFGDFAEGKPAVEGEDGPVGGVVGVATPVEGSLPAFAFDGVPAFGEPELGAGVAVGFDEGEVLGAGYGAGGETEGGEVDGVARGFIVEGEGVGVVGIGRDADFYYAGVSFRTGGEA